jgi:3-oxoacyl-[acyl-carrier protein] reductase
VSAEGARLPLRGRAALVTGVSRRAGIGFAIARRLGELGADVLAHGYAPADAEQAWGAEPGGVGGLAAALAQESPGRVEPLELDLADPAAPEQCVAAARAALGRVDILVANHARSSDQPLGGMTAAEIDVTMAVNVRATLLLVQAFAAEHDGRPGGRVVLLTSGQHKGPMPRELPYAASKGALHQLTPTLAAELAPRGITVNTVNPGPTDTGWAGPELAGFVARAMPTGRWGRPEDAARLIGWLCTDDAEWIVGQVIDSDGGFREPAPEG